MDLAHDGNIRLNLNLFGAIREVGPARLAMAMTSFALEAHGANKTDLENGSSKKGLGIGVD